MRELSIFIDESGDFGETRDVRDYYLVTFVFHDQSNDITEKTMQLEKSVKESGLDIEYIHAGPVIRKEGIFKEHMDYLKEYDKVIVYYDNGQRELGSILNVIFSIQLSNVEFRKAEPQKYRLLQAADFLCTIDLLQIKRDEKRLSKGEQQFFYKPNELKKTFIKGISKKRI